ncbi:NADH dehydrogenase-like protein [Paramyrothecium foliicola]|nr:NADH dehydrogenase-like protein [Paramyrothecium foliicola]
MAPVPITSDVSVPQPAGIRRRHRPGEATRTPEKPTPANNAPEEMQQRQHQRIVIVGTGFAGLWSALSARRLIDSQTTKIRGAADIEVVVVAPEPKFVLRPVLYLEEPSTRVIDLSDLYRVTGVKFVHGIVDGINTAEQEIDYLDREGAPWSLPYDRLILAAGSVLRRPEVPGLDEHAFNVDQLEDAVQLDDHLQALRFLPQSRARNTVVICGAGSTGIELATELPKRLRKLLGPSARLRVVLVSRENKAGSALGESPQGSVEKSLNRAGVECLSGSAVASIDAGGVTTANGQRIEASTVIWTAGMASTPLTACIDGQKDSSGRLHVDRNLRVPSTKEVFVTGDAACAVVDDAGNTTVMSCQHAQNLGRASGYNAAADLLGLPNVPYSQPLYLSCVDLGPDGAVVTIGFDRRIALNGALAKMLKNYINGTLLLPPPPHKEKAFAAAKMPSTMSQHIMNSFFSVLASIRSVF